MSPQLLERWAAAFIFTLAVEVPVFVAFARTGPAQERALWWRAVLAGAFGSCLTHPPLWFIWPKLFHDYASYVISGELLVASIESVTFFLIARPIRFSRAIAASFIANACSYGLGQMLRVLGIW